MQYVIDKHGRTRHAKVVTLERNGTTVFKGVPAEVCENCAEQYVDEATTQRHLAEANKAVESGVEVEIRAYAELWRKFMESQR
jgi:YgiT-type zinc finger domain-containing protein